MDPVVQPALAPPSIDPASRSTLPPVLDKRRATIRDMFAVVAPRYDRLNRLLSGRLDVVWRRKAARALSLPRGEQVLDLCCGTGDQALTLTQRGYQVLAADFCVPMLAIARGKYRDQAAPPRGMAADALALPYRDGELDGATVSFGLRNVADLDLALRELARVLRPGGQLVVLEFALPARQPVRGLYLFYFRHILPVIGRALSPHGSAYSYLPASVTEFPQRAGFVAHLAAAGFAPATWRDLTFGTVCLYRGIRETP